VLLLLRVHLLLEAAAAEQVAKLVELRALVVQAAAEQARQLAE
jgi:hypothetical protein